MKCQIPQISWHGRDPVLSVDFQPNQKCLYRLASGGTDSHVVIWYVTYQENKAIKIDCAADLYRHNKSVNVVRFSPNGELLASGDDEGAMFLWQLKEREQADVPKDDENQNKEDWYPLKSLRGHLEDIYDISWSADGNFLVSASMDNTAIIWDVQKFQKIHILSEYKGYVQGVSWDPRNQFIASIGTDRALRIHSVVSKKSLHKIQRAPWSVTTEKGTTKAKLFYDDTLQSYFRRLSFTPDGELLIVPSGIREKEEKFYNTSYVFSRHSFNKPVIQLPTGDKYTVAVRCNPHLYKLRAYSDQEKENELSKPMIDLPYRMIFAVATSDAVLMYDTQQLVPFAYVSNIHYTHLTDLTWSPDGLTLVASSTDGYCSFIIFTEEELGEIYVPEVVSVKSNLVTEVVGDINKENISVQSASSNSKNKDDDNVLLAASGNVPISVEKEKSASPKFIKNTTEIISPKMLKDGCNTPSPKNIKSFEKKSAKKPQKMCSIKSFFIPPKAKGLEETVASKKTCEDTDKKICVKSNINVSPKMKTEDDQSRNALSSGESNKNSISTKLASNRKEVLCKEQVEITSAEKEDSCSIEVVFQGPSSKHNSDQKLPKCKVQLSFDDKFKESKLKDNIPDVYSTDAVPFSDLKGEITSEVSENIENDWKLELSQDETDITPMEVETAKVNIISPMEVETAAVIKTVETKDNNVKSPSLSTKTSKRRIPFITLSTKIGSHQVDG